MGKLTNVESLNQGELFGRIDALEQRVAMLENELAIDRPRLSGIRQSETDTQMGQMDFSSSVIESRFGEFGLSWLGNLVLLFGIIFMMRYLQNQGMSFVSFIFGYATVAGLFLVSRYIRDSHKSMASVFSLNAYILLFHVTVMLHFFTSDPLIMVLILTWYSSWRSHLCKAIWLSGKDRKGWPFWLSSWGQSQLY